MRMWMISKINMSKSVFVYSLSLAFKSGCEEKNVRKISFGYCQFLLAPRCFVGITVSNGRVNSFIVSSSVYCSKQMNKPNRTGENEKGINSNSMNS